MDTNRYSICVDHNGISYFSQATELCQTEVHDLKKRILGGRPLTFIDQDGNWIFFSSTVLANSVVSIINHDGVTITPVQEPAEQPLGWLSKS